MRNSGSNWENVSLGESCGRLELESSLNQKDFGALPSPHLCMFGVKDPRSRKALKRPVRYLTNSPQLLKFVVRMCPNKHVHGPLKGLTNAYRSSSRWHTRAWAVESDAVKRHEACPAEDVEVDLTRADTR